MAISSVSNMMGITPAKFLTDDRLDNKSLAVDVSIEMFDERNGWRERKLDDAVENLNRSIKNFCSACYQCENVTIERSTYTAVNRDSTLHRFKATCKLNAKSGQMNCPKRMVYETAGSEEGRVLSTRELMEISQVARYNAPEAQPIYKGQPVYRDDKTGEYHVGVKHKRKDQPQTEADAW